MRRRADSIATSLTQLTCYKFKIKKSRQQQETKPMVEQRRLGTCMIVELHFRDLWSVSKSIVLPFHACSLLVYIVNQW